MTNWQRKSKIFFLNGTKTICRDVRSRGSDGKLVYKRAFGMANLDYDVPNTTSTLFNLASVVKTVYGNEHRSFGAAGKIVARRRHSQVRAEIPKYDDTITIRHLIHHTSGIREYQALVLFGGLGTDNAYSDKAILNMLARQKNISFKPGSKHQYSNSNYHLLESSSSA
jgi:CubicO group peptidase (beta-lactamase class C family)